MTVKRFDSGTDFSANLLAQNSLPILQFFHFLCFLIIQAQEHVYRLPC
jgi:hypothetical protein